MNGFLHYATGKGKLLNPPKLIIVDDPYSPSCRTAINDLGSMLAAKLLLMDTSKRIIIPSAEEWVGLNCLERDDDLPNRRKDG